MSNKTEPTTPLEYAADAINYTLQRIASDPNMRYHAGAFTETFERLKTAQAALTGKSPDEIEEEIFGERVRGESKAEKIDKIREIIEGDCDGAPDANAVAKLANKIMAIIRC